MVFKQVVEQYYHRYLIYYQTLIIIQMILIIVSILLILGGVYLYRELVSKPKSVIKFYKDLFEKNGFKVFVYPFQPLQSSQINTGLRSQVKSKDTLSFTKQVVSEFDVSIANIAHKVQINLISPQLMQAYFENDQQKYYEKEKFYIEGLKRTVGNSLTFAVGEQWKLKRRIITKMLNFTYIKDLVPKIANIAQRMTTQLLKSSQEKNIKDGFQEFNLLELTSDITSSSMIELFFGGGKDVSQIKINNMKVDMFIKKMLQLLLKQLFNPLTMIFGSKYTKLGVTQVDRELNRCIHLFENFVRNYVQKRLDILKTQYSKKQTLPDTYQDLIEAFYVQEIMRNKQQINQAFLLHLCDVFGGLYVAGTDTTSLNSLMALYYLIKNPTVLSKLEEQLQKNIPNIKELDYDLIKNCTYLEAVILESLRMYSSANGIFPRVALMDHYLKVNSNCSIPITKGTILNTQTVPIHYKQSVYNNPNDFKPQRFLNAKGEIINPVPYTWMNFSAGSRGCVGKQLAITEIKTIIITLLRLYSFKCEDQDRFMQYKSFSYGLQNVKFYLKKKQ